MKVINDPKYYLTTAPLRSANSLLRKRIIIWDSTKERPALAGIVLRVTGTSMLVEPFRTYKKLRTSTKVDMLAPPAAVLPRVRVDLVQQAGILPAPGTTDLFSPRYATYVFPVDANPGRYMEVKFPPTPKGT